MLIDTPYKQNDTVTVKLTGGDEIVARFETEDDNTVTVYKPLALTATQQGMGLVPFSFTIAEDAKLKLNKSAIVFIHKTQAEMASSYTESTTGLKIA
jgi:hypothetical protein